MKNIILILLVITIILAGCSSKAELSELQITACNSAEAGNSCDTKLEGLGLVTKAQCCERLEKCCGDSR